MISLIYLVFRLVLLAGFTFLFVVLFEHGPSGFQDGVKVEWEKAVKFAESFQSSKSAPAMPSATPAVTPSVAATPRPLSTPAAVQQDMPETTSTSSVAESAPAESAPVAPSETVDSAGPSGEYVPAAPPTVSTRTSTATATSSSSSAAGTPRPVSSRAPSAWLDLQKKEIGAPSSGTPAPKKSIPTDDE